jgi:hypothetical protein
MGVLRWAAGGQAKPARPGRREFRKQRSGKLFRGIGGGRVKQRGTAADWGQHMIVAIAPNAFMALSRSECGFVARQDIMRGHVLHSPSKERRVVMKSGMLPSRPRAEVAMVPCMPRVARARFSTRASDAVASAAGEGGGALMTLVGAT